MKILGPFLSVEDPDTFFFMRGFPDLPSRDPMKAQFYEGRLWKDESENVLMPMIERYDVVLVDDPQGLIDGADRGCSADFVSGVLVPRCRGGLPLRAARSVRRKLRFRRAFVASPGDYFGISRRRQVRTLWWRNPDASLTSTDLVAHTCLPRKNLRGEESGTPPPRMPATARS